MNVLWIVFDVENETPEDVGRRLKEFLITNRMSQKKFAESLLNMRQANFCTLLSQPASWKNLSKTCRERFQTIYLWLEDPDRMQKLENSGNKNLASLISKLQVQRLTLKSFGINSSVSPAIFSSHSVPFKQLDNDQPDFDD